MIIKLVQIVLKNIDLDGKFMLLERWPQMLTRLVRNNEIQTNSMQNTKASLSPFDSNSSNA